MKPESLIHITTTTGHTRVSPRSEVGELAILAMVGWAARTNGALRPLPVLTQLMAGVDMGPGWAQLFVYGRLGESGRIMKVLECHLAWTPEADAGLWPKVDEATMRSCGRSWASGIQKPESTPWLAAVLPLSSTLLTARELMMLGDLERCWAWAVIEGRPAKEWRNRT